MDYQDVRVAIARGELDDDLRDLNKLVIARIRENQRVKGQAVGARLRSGSTARITSINPRYLIGAVVEIERVNSTRAVCRMPSSPSYRKWSGRSGVTIPLSCLEVIE